MASIKRRVAVVVGARPNFMKAAPLVNYWRKKDVFEYVFIHSGQHYDPVMTTDILADLNAPQFDIVMKIPKEGSSIRYSVLLRNFRNFFREYRFDAVVVFGDVNTTVSATLAAREASLPVIHVESGLRSHDVSMPEEVNRIITDNYSQLHLCTENSAIENLREEGFGEASLKLVGNLMIEALINISGNLNMCQRSASKEYLLTTFHRAENIYSEKRLKRYSEFLIDISKYYSVKFPVHPATYNCLSSLGYIEKLRFAGVDVMPPQKYGDFISLMRNSALVLTDSGGIQEEAVYMQKPILTLRDNTERPSTVECGINRLASIEDLDRLFVENHILSCKNLEAKIPFWDSEVSRRITYEIEKCFG